MKRKALKAAFPHTIPIFTGFFFLGAAYGIYMSTSGFSFVYPMLMSLLIFGGSLEFVAVEMLLSPFSPVSVFVMAVLIQARHLFYGISMLDKFKGTGLCIAGTMLTRFLPFIVFRENKKTPAYIQYIGKFLPSAVFGMLVVYCLKNVNILQGSHGLLHAVDSFCVLESPWVLNLFCHFNCFRLLFTLFLFVCFILLICLVLFNINRYDSKYH